MGVGIYYPEMMKMEMVRIWMLVIRVGMVWIGIVGVMKVWMLRV